MRFLMAAIVLSLLTDVGFAQQTTKPTVPKDLKVTADDVKSPPSTTQSPTIPPQFQPSWFERNKGLVVLAGAFVVVVVGGCILQRFRSQK